MRPFVFQVISICAALLLCALQAEAAQVKTRSCGASAIRAAAAQQVAPRLVGCRYDDVAVPLAQYFSIFPALTKTPGDEATSTIVEQTPAAGQPLLAGGQLALQVSVGESHPPLPEKAPGFTPVEAAPASTPPEGSKPVETKPVKPKPADSGPVQADTPTLTVAAPAAPVQAREAASQQALPKLNLPNITLPAYLMRPGLLWAWLVIGVVGVWVSLKWRRRRPSPDVTYERVPQVSARFEFGPSRVTASGPLIVESGEP
jgi:hypothetical protein